jgi:type IV secretion system protein VirD4
MRWTKVVIGLLCTILLGYVLLYVWPIAAPIIAQHPPHLLSTILDELLKPHPDQGVGQYYPIVLLILGGAIYFVVDYDLKHRPRRTHGSARHARGKEVSRYRTPRTLPRFRFKRPTLSALAPLGLALQSMVNAGQRREFRLYLGRYRGRDISLSEWQQYEHVLLTAPTGAGKSTRFIIPDLLRETGARSLFVADLKGELYKVTVGWLSQQMQIWLFAPTSPKISQGYNPLAHIKGVEDAQDFAETWVANTGSGGKDANYWENNARLLISATVLHLLATEKAPPFSRLADLITNQSFDDIREMFNKTRSRDARYIARQFVESMQKNERLIGSIMTEIGNRFQFLASPNARAVTAVNNIDFDEMIQTPTAFFLSIPRAEVRRYRPLLSVLTEQMFKAWEKHGTNGMACYLDEFTNLGYLPGFGDFIATARSLKVGLFMAIQNFSQLVERYGKNDAETIKANAVTHLLLPGAGLEETRYYSERMGDATVPTYTVNRRGSGMAQELTFTEGETRRRLMTPDELRTMPGDQMLLLDARSAPILLKTTKYFEDKRLVQRANLPYNLSQVRVEPTPPPAAPSTPKGLPAGSSASSSTGQGAPVVDADIEKDDDILFADE